MALDRGDTLALVALIVSLIALFNGFLQAAQQLFGTAEGYRNCRDTIIGPWSATRHRKWIWREFRFEVLYQTPQIMLLTDADFQTERERRRVCLLSQVHEDPGSYPPYRDGSIYHMILNQFFSAGPPKAILDTACPEGFKGGKSDSGFVNPELSSAVDWQKLLRVLHKVYTAYWEKEGKHFNDHSYTPNKQPAQTINYKLRDVQEVEKTTAAVAYRLHSWDFNPPDVVRPLASTTLGDIVVLVMRMGMTWRVLKPGDAQMQADGAGYTVTSTKIRGVGTVLQFDFEMRDEQLIQYIPSSDSDKMLCGILPVDSELVRKEPFEMFDGKSEVPNIMPILLFLGVENSARDALNKSDLQKFIPGFSEVWTRTAFNDIIFFLAPYMPLEGTAAAYVGFRGFLSLSPTNCMTYWEARLALLYRLEQRTKNMAKDSKLVSIREAMQKFERDHYGEFYAIDSRSHADYYRSPGPKPIKLPEICRNVWWETKTYFKSLQRTKSADRLYCDLVAAHCSMAVPAALAAHDRATPDHGKRRLDYSIHRNRSPRLNMKDMYEIAWSYVDFVEQGRIHKELLRLNDDHSPLSPEEAEEAWWMMILRGINWGLSVYICTSDHRPEGRVSIVPSYIYKNPTPIWLA